MDAEYTCTLTEKSLRLARDELNENPVDRLGSVTKLREWVEQQDHIKCRTDTTFLLRFLRTAKFSQLRAREIIEGYLRLRQDQPEFFYNWVPAEKYLEAFLRAGLFLILPGYLENGAKVVIWRFEYMLKANAGVKLQAYKKVIHKAFHLVIHHLNREEAVQVAGIVYVMDFSNTSTKTATMFSPGEARDIMKFQNNVAGRFKGFWFYNEGPVMTLGLNIFQPIMKKKMQERMKMLGNNLERLYKHIPMSMLPVEYLPDDYTGPNAGTCQNLIDAMWQEMTTPDSVREYALESDPKWSINTMKKAVNASTESFRKLTID